MCCIFLPAFVRDSYLVISRGGGARLMFRWQQETHPEDFLLQNISILIFHFHENGGCHFDLVI